MDRRRIYGVSQDSPSYFRTSHFTELQPPSPAAARVRGTGSLLHLGVSSEAPDNFHLRYASVVSPEQRNVLLERSIGNTSERAGLAFAHKDAGNRLGFRYQDFGEHKGEIVDQTTIKPTSFIDLLVGKNTAKMYKLPYYQEYYSALRSGGFAHQPSELSHNASQNDILVRRDIRVLRSLQNSLNQSKLQPSRKLSEAKLTSRNSGSGAKAAKASANRWRSREAGQTIQAISDFEGKLAESQRLPPIQKTSWEKYQWSG